jgi:peptide deformylase
MVSKVLKYGSSILRQRSAEASGSENLTLLINNLFDTLQQEGGIGLAAPQIGELKKVFVMDTYPVAENDKYVEAFRRVVINPEIIASGNEKVKYTEGCLSIPGISEEVERPEKIEVKYLDEEIQPVVRKIDGLEARIFQHEFDHLEGVLFVDRLHPLRKAMISGKLKRLAQETKKKKKS